MSITLAVIGVVAAMTLPTLITSARTKANDTKKDVFKARILNGLKEIAVQSSLMGYDSTMKFVQELGKILGVMRLINFFSNVR